jgi:hypothetical protein
MDHSVGKFTVPELLVACLEKQLVDKKAMKTKLGIRYSDNDFNNTIRGFLRTFHDGIMWNHRDIIDKLTKPRIVALFNSLVPGLYLLYQHGYRDIRRESDPPRIKITEENVFLDEEVDEYLTWLKEEKMGNCEFHYYDYHGTLMSKMTGQVLEPIIIGV